MKNYLKLSLKLHRKHNGKLEIKSKVPLESKEDLSIAYTPGVAGPCLEIAKNKNTAYELTSSKKTVAIVSDGSAVLGLGDIGPEASLPVMEGKALLFKKFAGIDAFPIVIKSKNVDEIVKTIKNISPSFGGINLEDISSPRAFEIEKRLKKELDIPVFHDDQHGTAIVVLAGLINALKIVKKDKNINIVINGAGSAGIAIAKLLFKYGFKNLIICDSKGIICKKRRDLTKIKKELLKFSNKKNLCGYLFDAIKNSDVFIGVSKPNLLSNKHIEAMNKDPIIFALANPEPEISPILANKLGVKIIATGRSDFPNQINNVLAFPGIFKGAFEVKAKKITDEMKISAAKALAGLVKIPLPAKIIPSVFDLDVCEVVAKAVRTTIENKKN